MGGLLLVGGVMTICGVTSHAVTRVVKGSRNEITHKANRDTIKKLIQEKKELERSIEISKNKRCKAIAKKKKECSRIEKELL